MGQFKPMVKMMTTEPSVILKLKKGGKVAKKADGGFMPMASSMPAGLPARGGMAPAASPMKPSLAARRRAMNPNLLMKKGGKAEKHEDAAQDRAMIKKALAGKKFASGGEIDSAETKTTLKNSVAPYAKTKVHDGDKNDSAKGTGGVKNGNKGGYANGGTIEGNAGKYANTKVNDGDKTDTAKGTGGVKNGNGGGFKSGGTIKGGDWENRPADTAKAGKSGGTTGGVRNGNAGGYKDGGRTKVGGSDNLYVESDQPGGDKRGGSIKKGGSAKKAYATGGKVDSGKAVAMPRKPVSRPVANSLQSGTFKKGGKVGKYADGDLVDASKGAYEKSIGPSKEEMDMAKAIRSIPSKLYEGAKGMLGFGSAPKPAGSVTKTEKSVTVAPASKKRGGRC